MLSAALRTSLSVEWETPQPLFDELNAEFGPFDIDVCALPGNAKCERYFAPADDGLAQPWIGRCWCNPPYGRQLYAWLTKAYESAVAGALVVCLIPARTDTSWWHDFVLKASEVRFIRGRLKFGPDPRRRAPFPSAVVIFRPGAS